MIQEMHERLKKANERRNCRADEEIAILRAALAAKEQELRDAYALAYIGEHRFPDLTWKSRAAEMVAALAAKDAEIERLTTVNEAPGCGGKTHAEAIESLLKVQRDNLTDAYMVGLYNGLYTAYATITGKDHPLGLADCAALANAAPEQKGEKDE